MTLFAFVINVELVGILDEINVKTVEKSKLPEMFATEPGNVDSWLLAIINIYADGFQWSLFRLMSQVGSKQLASWLFRHTRRANKPLEAVIIAGDRYVTGNFVQLSAVAPRCNANIARYQDAIQFKFDTIIAQEFIYFP